MRGPWAKRSCLASPSARVYPLMFWRPHMGPRSCLTSYAETLLSARAFSCGIDDGQGRGRVMQGVFLLRWCQPRELWWKAVAIRCRRRLPSLRGEFHATAWAPAPPNSARPPLAPSSMAARVGARRRRTWPSSEAVPPPPPRARSQRRAARAPDVAGVDRSGLGGL